MPAAFDTAVAELYQAPLGTFVAERKRLAKQLPKDDAKRFAKLPRPPISAWVVNQLWWHARDAFDRLLATADQLRDGDLAAATAHRDAIAKLRARAASILTDAGHGATEATLRRVTQTLAALAAAGGFDPDPPGALAADRDPPGFEAVGILAPATAEPEEEAAEPAAAHASKAKHDGKAKHSADDLAAAKRHHEAKLAAERAEAAAERRRIEEQRAKQKAERHRLEAALRTAKGDVHTRERELAKLDKELAAARARLAQATEVVEDLEAKLEALEN